MKISNSDETHSFVCHGAMSRAAKDLGFPKAEFEFHSHGSQNRGTQEEMKRKPQMY